jgi:hypothetical protein
MELLIGPDKRQYYYADTCIGTPRVQVTLLCALKLLEWHLVH